MFETRWPLLCLFFFTSCQSLSQKEQTKDLLSPPSVSNSIENSLKTPFFSLGQWPEKNWWEVFESPHLNHLIQQALLSNPTIQAIEKKIDFEKQKTTIARSKLFPLVFFDFNENWDYLSHNGLYRQLNPTVPINVNLLDLSLGFNYEFDFWGKYRNLFKAAIGEMKAVEAENEDVKLIITTALAQSYFALLTNYARKDLYQELLEIREKIFDLQKLLVNHQLLSAIPPLLTEEDVWKARQYLASIDEEIEANEHLINTLAGVGPDQTVEIDASLPTLPITLQIPEHLSMDLLARRPDLMAQIWKVEALAHEVGAAKADFYPNINLAGLLGFESAGYAMLFQRKSLTAGLNPAIHLPIFTAGAIKANIRGKKALFDQAVYQYNNLILKSLQEVSDLISFATSIFKQKKAQESIVENATARFNLTNLRMISGLDSALVPYYYKEELILKKLDDITLLYNQYLAVIKLTKALGGGYNSAYSIPITAERDSS